MLLTVLSAIVGYHMAADDGGKMAE